MAIILLNIKSLLFIIGIISNLVAKHTVKAEEDLDLNSIEEARGYKRLSDEFKYDHENISKLMSKSRSHVSNTLRLLTLPSDVIAMLEEGTLTSGQARPLIGLINASAIAEEIVTKNYSARKIEYLVKKKKMLLQINTIKLMQIF